MELDIAFLIITGAVAFHALTHRNEEGERETVRLLFGCIALLFFFRVLFVDILNLWN